MLFAFVLAAIAACYATPLKIAQAKQALTVVGPGKAHGKSISNVDDVNGVVNKVENDGEAGAGGYVDAAGDALGYDDESSK